MDLLADRTDWVRKAIQSGLDETTQAYGKRVSKQEIMARVERELEDEG